jgi:hypothetical protein
VGDTRTVTAFLNTALHDGSVWFLLACLAVLVGVVGLYTRGGSGIDAHPSEGPGDMPLEADGHEELETLLSPRRAGRRAAADRKNA